MIEAILNGITGFFGTHLKLIIGVIVNIVIIYAFCKIADACNRKFVIPARLSQMVDED